MRQTRFFLLLCGFILMGAPSADAGTARSVALGGDGAYFLDSANVLQWYASLERYPDRLVLEPGDVVHNKDRALSAMGWLGHGGGAHVRLNGTGNAGTVAFYFQDHLDKADDDGAFALLYSRRLGAWRLGVAGRFTTFGKFRAVSGGDIVVDGQYFHTYGLGLGRRLNDVWEAELAGEIINTMTDFPHTAGGVSSDTWKSYGLRLRLRGRLGEDLTLVPVLSRTRRQGGYYSDLLGDPADQDAAVTTLGLGVNLYRPDGALIIISGEYRRGSQNWALREGSTQEAVWDASAQDFHQIRGRLGLESDLMECLTVRMAAQYLRHHEEIERKAFAATGEGLDDKESILNISVATPLSLGLAWRHGPLTVDLTYNDTAALNPGLAGEGLMMGNREGYSVVTITRKF
ncbi:hypothetical protein COW53_10565 [bacterium CG17_big_fil_post_rev_8_21_14_2_50_64_8]|nr:MAG: hypothetical protein COW53_10565 [bacterium CG17_big_fil_post_rev_8_21_14_2_50_64_8]PJA73902.1 MAG: hypothetical protein CO151_10970 [bacterium CG_4_9_14_3_um_filter_65_15]